MKNLRTKDYFPEDLIEIYNNRKNVIKSSVNSPDFILNKKLDNSTYYIIPRKKIKPFYILSVGIIFFWLAIIIALDWEANDLGMFLLFLCFLLIGTFSISTFISDLIEMIRGALILTSTGFLYLKSPKKIEFIRWDCIQNIKKYYKNIYSDEGGETIQKVIIIMDDDEIKLDFKLYNRNYTISLDLFYNIFQKFFETFNKSRGIMN